MEEQEEQPSLDLPTSVGTRLRIAREAAGLGLEDIVARTKIAERHLLSIEQDRFSDLAGRTYSVGFSRAYARSVGLDEAEIAEAVRAQLSEHEQANPRAQLETFEPGDPARVPSARLAWAAAIGGVLVVVVLLILFWPSFLSPQADLPDLLADESEVQPVAAAPDAGGPPVQAGSAVVFTATEPRVWVKFTDAAGIQLFQKELASGESYSLPPNVEGPLLWTARPDALAITVGGKSVARLSDKPETVKNVPVSAKVLLARVNASAPRTAPPGSREAAVEPPRAISRPAPPPTATSRRTTRSEPASSPRTAVSRPRDEAAPRPEPAASAPTPAQEAPVSIAPAPAEIAGEAEAMVPVVEPVSVDSTPPSTVSE
ncbi:MAG: DUF4115 domain-containing protein [Novosphingobium sp.]|nr:DUF4115 domain-containing protein [Novosphingobium sp.]